MSLTCTHLLDTRSWNATIRELPNAHVLQSAEWGAFKQRATGWKPDHYLFRDEQGVLVGAALTLTRRIGPLAVMYVPKGPICDYSNAAYLEDILRHLERIAQAARAIHIKIDPDIIAGTGIPGEADAADHPDGQRAVSLLQGHGWRLSAEQIQFRNTIEIDLSQSEEDLLAAMGQGKRRKVRYGARHGVSVRTGTLDDLPVLYALYAETGKRDHFLTRPYEYYIDEWGSLIRAGLGHVLVAEVENKPIAHVILFHFGQKCLYFTGASVSDNEIRKRMPADLLQWEAIRWAKAQGYRTYDFWGAPDTFSESDRMWGVFQFKRDFGGVIVRHIGAWDYAPSPLLYDLYTRAMPQVLNVMRRRAHRTLEPTTSEVTNETPN